MWNRRPMTSTAESAGTDDLVRLSEHLYWQQDTRNASTVVDRDAALVVNPASAGNHAPLAGRRC